MNAEIHHLDTPARFGQQAAPRLRTLVVCDIADSTALVERMGDQNGANIIRKHDRLARALIEKHHGREIDKTDGFLLLFERPIQAVAFALDYQRGLVHLSAAEGMVLRARVGIHMGDVVIWENAPEDVARGAKPIEVEGLVKPVAARLAQLAKPQQTLVSSAAAGIARRAQTELGSEVTARLHWKTHGPYRFKGLPESMEVIEVGEDEIAPLRAPRSGRTAKKILPWWRRPLTLAAEAAMLAVGIGIGAWFLLQSPPTLAFAKRDWVVVGDLHNLTGDPRFNQSVETALHISLEQSQYVNVLPELSVQQTLQRMERNPDNTPVNRAIGSEIAMRDGARALILPTLAEVGGRVRVTAEVVDPNTQTTVYSVSADGDGAQSVLPSLDNVSKQLRFKLGEALAMVSKESQPLDKVATSNLDALRAYSLGMHAQDTGNFKEAQSLFQQALKLDPGFALAHVALVRVFFETDQSALADSELQAAAALRNRLSARDSLYVDAWIATLQEPPSAALEKWRILGKMYPDFFPAEGSLAYFDWLYGNRFDEAIGAAQKSSSPHNPNRRGSDYLLGTLYLGANRYGDAIKSFTTAKLLGLVLQNEYFAASYAAQRQFGEAETTLGAGRLSGVASNDINTSVMSVAFAVDQGEWNQAITSIEKAKQQASKIGPSSALQFSSMELVLQSIQSAPNKLDLKITHEKLVTTPGDKSAAQFRALLDAYLAAHFNEIGIAKDDLREAGSNADFEGFPVLRNMQLVAQAEVARAERHPEDAIRLLVPLIDGTELCITHVALMDAYKDDGNRGGALREAQWLATNRGRAYAEYNIQQVLTPFNVAQSDLALLEAAELSLSFGDKAGAKKSLNDFLHAWPQGERVSFLAGRVKKISAAL